MSALDDVLHLPIEECEDQRADVRAVDVGVGHDDDLVIAQLADIEIVDADSGAERGDHQPDFLGRKHLVEARLLDVENFSFQRKDCLKAAIASLFC